MPFFSIIVPSYGNAAYLPSCLQSVLDQGFQDWELLVVDDASPDGSAAVVERFARDDERIRLVRNEQNEGLHLVRKRGVAESKGKYVIFVDADDELTKGCLAKLHEALAVSNVASLHFGMHICPQCGVSEETARLFGEWANAPFSILHQPELMDLVFSPTDGYVRDWRITQRALRSDVAKDAFAVMVDERLERAEDAYEYFVVSSGLQQEDTRNDIIAYEYQLGRGVTGVDMLSDEAFLAAARQFVACYEAALLFAEQTDAERLMPLAFGLKFKLLEALGNEWHDRVSDADKAATARSLAGIAGLDETVCELNRAVRDDAYKLWASGSPFTGEESFIAWLKLADELASTSALSPRACDMRRQARNNVRNLEIRAEREMLLKRWDDQRIRILIAAHKDVDLFESDILQPIQVGAANAAVRFGHMLHDDEGENISDLNAQYCELTAQYWAWKNVDADYYGFCHYRRYFDFSDERHEENDYGEVMDGVIDAETQARYRLDDASIAAAIEGYDIVTTEVKDLRTFPFRANTPLEHYAEAELLKEDDLPCVLALVEEMHPDYVEDVEAFANGNFTCFCNMYILKKDVFFDYCEWVFPILERFRSVTDMSTYSKEAMRTPGHLSERLFNIYLNHHLRTGANWKTKQLQCVHFEFPDKTNAPVLPGLQLEQPLPVVPVVFAADNNYVPMLTTTIHSMLENASPDSFYDVVVLENGITGYNQNVMRDFLARENVSVRFVNAGSLVAEYDLSTNNDHIGIETYFRFLIQDILPDYDKVLYLDSDLIVEGDVAKLYATDLQDDLLAAVRDVDFLGNLNLKDGNRLRYNDETLHMKNPYDYFQAGVLVLNTEAMRAAHTVEEWLTFASNPDYIYNDQDVLNACCEGRVRYLDPRWNVMNDCGNRIHNVFQHAPADVYAEFLAAYGDAWIIHYAGFEKPWRTWYCDRNETYWEYARETPFYEVMLHMLLQNERPDAAPVGKRPALPVGKAVRKIANPLMPVGSKRREMAKNLAWKLKGK